MTEIRTTPNAPADSSRINGYFLVDKGEGNIVAMTFMNLMIELGLYTLKNSRDAFQTQFERAQEKVNCMQELNKLVQSINTVKSKFPDHKDLKSDDVLPLMDHGELKNLYNQIQEFNRKYPNSKLACGDVFQLWPDNDTGKKEDSNPAEPLRYRVGKDITNVVKRDDYKKYIEEMTGNKSYTAITKQGAETLSSNAQTVQSTLSSENEQQSMRTNQAMNRSSGFLQQLQAMMQSAKEALQAASKAGGH